MNSLWDIQRQTTDHGPTDRRTRTITKDPSGKPGVQYKFKYQSTCGLPECCSDRFLICTQLSLHLPTPSTIIRMCRAVDDLLNLHALFSPKLIERTGERWLQTLFTQVRPRSKWKLLNSNIKVSIIVANTILIAKEDFEVLSLFESEDAILS